MDFIAANSSQRLASLCAKIGIFVSQRPNQCGRRIRGGWSNEPKTSSAVHTIIRWLRREFEKSLPFADLEVERMTQVSDPVTAQAQPSDQFRHDFWTGRE